MFVVVAPQRVWEEADPEKPEQSEQEKQQEEVSLSSLFKTCIR